MTQLLRAASWCCRVTLVPIGAMAQAPGPPLPARISIPAGGTNVAMGDFAGRPLVQVRISGHPYWFILDTGAQGSVIDSSLAAELRLAVTGEMLVGSPGGAPVRVRSVHLDRLDIGGAKVTLDVPALNLAAMFRMAADAPRGVLSAGVFTPYLLTLDFPGKRVLVTTGALPEPDGRDVVTFDPAARLVEIPVDVAGKTITVDLDTGSPGGLTLPLAMADSLPLVAPPAQVGVAHRVGRELTLYTARLHGAVRVGPLVLDAPDIGFIGDSSADVRGNIGQALLHRFVVTIDRTNARVQLRPPR